MTTAEEAAGVFDVGGPIVSVQSHPTGHINDAYLVMTDRKRYLLQRLNPTVVADLDPARLRVSLPGFHDPQRRMAQLEAAVKSDPRDRLDAARQEVDALHALWPTIGSGLDRLPVHVAHNDAKAANLLVDEIG